MQEYDIRAQTIMADKNTVCNKLGPKLLMAIHSIICSLD